MDAAEVSDSGTGLTAKKAQRAFELYDTTAEVGQLVDGASTRQKGGRKAPWAKAPNRGTAKAVIARAEESCKARSTLLTQHGGNAYDGTNTPECLMDIEFHYFITYLIAARAGYSPDEATIIAHAAQSVDDNHIPVRIVDEGGCAYENEISQTFDILHAHEDARVYPVFHFIPGEPSAPSARRKDGLQHPMMTTPDSPLANAMMDAACASSDLYRIGVSAHGYVDTWAHQNFVGKRDAVNEFSTTFWGKLEQRILAVGHAHARHLPDWPALVWQDTRLVHPIVDNRARFLDAAAALFRKLAHARRSAMPEAQMRAEVAALRRDLDADIGPRDDRNERAASRRRAYVERSRTADYGGTEMPDYRVGAWFDEAITEPRATVRERLETALTAGTFGELGKFVGDWLATNNRQPVHWKNPSSEVYKRTHWFLFQQAVKAHLDECHSLVQSHLLSRQS